MNAGSNGSWTEQGGGSGRGSGSGISTLQRFRLAFVQEGLDDGPSSASSPDSIFRPWTGLAARLSPSLGRRPLISRYKPARRPSPPRAGGVPRGINAVTIDHAGPGSIRPRVRDVWPRRRRHNIHALIDLSSRAGFPGCRSPGSCIDFRVFRNVTDRLRPL